MSTQRQAVSDRLYQALLRLLPFDFRSEFGSDMEQAFHEQRTHTKRERGSVALLRMWWTTIVDIFRMAPREHLSVLAQDTRYALRMMRNNPGYTFVAVTILGLGIGANSAIFSVVNSVLLQPLPYVKGDRLVILRQRAAKLDGNMAFSVKEIADYRERNRSLSALEEYHSMTFTLFSRTGAHRVRTGVVSAGFFDMFGVRPMLGRTFTPDDERQGAPAVLMLSYEFWKEKQGADPQIVGKTFEMNDRVHTVIGVLPPIPQYPNENDVYMPTSACPFRSSARMIGNRDAHMMSVFARMKPGVTVEQSRADLAPIARQLETEYPKSYTKALGYQINSLGLKDELTRNARTMLLLLLGAAAFVLIIACANVANLILSRMARRERELVIRTAMGAGSGRLLRQLLTESFIMALLAAGVGLALASGSLKLLAQFAGQLTPRAREIAIDNWVLLFAVFCASATAIVFGSVGALYSRAEIASGLKESGSQTTLSANRNFIRSALIVAQVAFSCVLLVGAGLMVRSLIELDHVNPGFVPQHVLTMAIDLNWSKYGTPQQTRSVASRLAEKIQALPGVLSAAVSSSFPLDPDAASGGGGWTTGFQIEGVTQTERDAVRIASMRVASPDYFRTLGIPLVAGRTFRDSDNADAPQVAVISQALARHRWNGQDAIGRRLSFDRGETWIKIVGIVGDVKEFGLNKEPTEQIYRPQAQRPAVGSVLVRTSDDPIKLSQQLRRAVLEIDPQTAIANVETLDQARSDSVSSPRTTARLFGLFAGLALVIAVTGLGCILALSVRQRMREIGIRVALGASPIDIVSGVVRQGMMLVIVGLAIGLTGAVALTRFLKALLFQVTPTDPSTFVLISALLLCATLVACYVPARRAARIDPQTALRCD